MELASISKLLPQDTGIIPNTHVDSETEDESDVPQGFGDVPVIHGRELESLLSSSEPRSTHFGAKNIFCQQRLSDTLQCGSCLSIGEKGLIK